jgi:hypothetical protein
MKASLEIREYARELENSMYTAIRLKMGKWPATVGIGYENCLN